MSKTKKRLIFSILLLLVGGFLLAKLIQNNTSDVLINITELPQEFMDEYYAGTKQLKANANEDNILIVSTLKDLSETYGATDVVAAPNHQYFLQYPTAAEKEQALARFKEDKSIVSVDENYVRHLDAVEYNSWGIETMYLDSALEVANDASNTNLSDVVVAVIDSGVDVGLAERYYPGKIIGTYDVFNQSELTTEMTDENGHGTHVFGTIAEGTAKNVKILPIKVSKDGSISSLDIITAVNYVTRDHRADVINMSFGGSGYSDAEYEAIEAAKQEKIISVAAAGNSNSSLAHYPSGFDNTISIASIDSELNKSTFSNYGSTVDFAAPGTMIKSIMSKDAAIAQQNGNLDGDDDHETISGTSMATPHAAAAVAMLKSYEIGLRLDDVKDLLQQTALDLGRQGKDDYYGYGLITFFNAEFCIDDVDCDEYGVYKDDMNQNLEIKSIETEQSSYFIHQNYGNITNLMNIKLKIYYDDRIFVTQALADLDGVEIDGYKPELKYDQETGEGAQTVTIRYRGFSVDVEIKNIPSSDHVWVYEHNSDGTITITGIKYGNISNDFPRAIYIPESIEDLKVVALGDALFKDRKELRRIELPETIVSIGKEALYGCDNINTIIFPDSLEFIGTAAFKNTNLQSVSFPEGLGTIGDNAFENTSITEVKIPKKTTFIGAYAFAGCNNITKISVDSENEVYDDRSGLDVIVKTDDSILVEALYNVELPDSIKVIGEGVYYNDDQVEEVHIPDSVTIIESGAFRYDTTEIASQLSKIYIPSSVSTINASAFNTKDKQITLYVMSVSYAKDYAIFRNLPYQTMDYSSSYADLLNYQYHAFDTVSGEIRVQLNYEYGYYSGSNYHSGATKSEVVYQGDVSELAAHGLMLVYPDERDSLRYGDTSVKVTGKDSYGEDFSASAMVQVAKLTPIYAVPGNLTAEIGQTLDNIELPDGFEWMNPDTAITTVGEQTFKAKYTPEDTTNYEIVEDIDIVILVTKTVVTPEISVADKVYDGTANLSEDDITITGLDTDEYTITATSIDDVEVGETTANVTLRLADEVFETTMFDNGAQEKTFFTTIQILPQPVEKPTPVEKTYTYTGESQSFELQNFNGASMNITGDQRTIVGSQEVTVSLKSANYIWSDDTTADLTFTFMINPAEIDVQDNTENASYAWDGEPHSLTLSLVGDNLQVKFMDDNGDYVLEDSPSYTDLGTYTVKYKVYIDENYTEYFGEKTIAITQKPIQKPTPVEKTYTYNGESQEFELQGLDRSTMNIDGDLRTQAGSQNVTISLSSPNYIWSDNTTEPLVFEFVINKAAISVEDNTADAIFFWDHEPHTISLSIVGENLHVKFMDDSGHYTLDEAPSYTDLGTYTIKYKVYIDENYTEYFGERTMTIARAIYTVTFYANDGTDTSVTQEMEDSVETALRKNTFTKTGSRFTGWNTRANGSGNRYDDEDVIAISSNIELYAQWEEDFDYIINHYVVDDTNHYISHISVNTKVNDFTAHITLNSGYSVQVDTIEVDGVEVLYTGGKTKIMRGNEVYREFTNVVTGDIDGDGEITSAELLRVQWHLLNKNILTGFNFLAADVNYDDEINSAELLRIKQHLLGKVTIE